MDSLASILVHVDGGRHSLQRLQWARGLAAQHAAQARALFAVSPRFLPLPLPEGGAIPPEPLLDEIEPKHREQAKASFARASGGSGWPMQWRELDGEAPIAGFARQALTHDLLVLGQHDGTDPSARDVPADFVPSVLIESGRPAIVLPKASPHTFEEFSNVLLAWWPTRECAAALVAALPMLQRAQEVHLVSCADEAHPAVRMHEEVIEHLRNHGVESVRRHRSTDAHDPGAALLALAGGIGADLLVMGCYGHSRARELVLGGATRTVLRDLDLPVLMSH
jgi:nucleotide-binding universal stress UspA family protein